MRPACHLDTQNIRQFDSLDTQMFSQDLLMMTIPRLFNKIVHVVSLLQYKQSSYWPKKAKSVYI